MGRSADLPRSSGEIDGDDRGCHVLHVDMDAFFASVEIRARPELRGLPVVVGGTEGRGVVAAASYAARVYGIRSAMSMAQALRLCPSLIVIQPQRGVYSETSAQIMRIFADFTPLVEPLSLDEAFLDVSGAVGIFGRPAEIARQIRRRVFEEQQLTCSVGVAPIKSVAKLASGSCKPNGLRVVSQAGLLDFLHPLPVTALWGVGARTAESLRRLGIRTVGDLAATPVDTLRRAVGTAVATHLHNLARGVDNRAVTTGAEEKSISTDRTLARDLLAEAEVARELLRGAGEVTERLRHVHKVARTVGIKIRFADFTTVTRVRTLAEPTDAAAVVYAEALQLYRALRLDQPRIRLVGVKVENLRPADEATQLALDLTGAAKRPAPATDHAIDALVARFGESVVRPASLLTPGSAPTVGGLTRARQRPGRGEVTNLGNPPVNPGS
ncbi:MAG TPA: DNA polymerase IV [Jatrophihabitans sp.]|nr:DNA polymerase IV [Jatrophihabitans sp.]